MSSSAASRQRRVNMTLVAALLGIAAVAWFLSIRQASDMGTMVMGLGQIGVRMPNDTSALLFMPMWLVMMVAMMFPAVAPLVLIHRTVVRKRGEGWAPSVAFVLGYLAIWTVIGLVPLAAFLAFRSLASPAPWLVAAAGIILIVAGFYQFTPLKSTCLRACRNPLSFVMQHDFGKGAPGAFRAGASHGLFCLGCCWALMAVLVVVGFMNLVWMGTLALLFFAEKNWRRGVLLSRLAGTAIAALGFAVLLHPALLPSIS